MTTTLHNNETTLQPKIERTNLRTITGKAIYLKTSYDGTKTYVTKGRKIVLQQSNGTKRYKATSAACWNSLDPLEHEQLYKEYPERFSGYRMELLRKSILNQKGARINVHV
jgi:hypothetical protein